jgi:hypothetical protein
MYANAEAVTKAAATRVTPTTVIIFQVFIFVFHL